MFPNLPPLLLSFASPPEKTQEENSPPRIFPFLSPEVGFKSDNFVGRKRLPIRGAALGYDLGLQFGVGFGHGENFHLLGLANRFKDLYDLKGSGQGVDWKTWGFKLFYSYRGALQVGAGHGYSWSRRADSRLDSRDGFHLNADFKINPLFLAKKIFWLTMEIQPLELDIYYRLGTVGLGFGLYLKGWIPLSP